MKINTINRKIHDDFKLSKNDLHESIESFEIKSDLNTIPIEWDSAKGHSVFDSKGNCWIDLTSGIFVANVGHSHPEIGKALSSSFNEGKVFSYSYASKIRDNYDRALLKASPKHFKKIAHFTSGTEPVFSSYKIMKTWGNQNNKKYIITFRGNYHGRGLGNEFICGDENRSSWSGVRDENVIFLDFPFNENDSFDASKLPNPDEIIGFILETFQGWGACFYPEKFIKDLFKFRSDHNLLLCFDEMQAGFHRLGPLFGYQTYGDEIKPDLICLGKGISSSLPYSALLMTEEMGKTAEGLHLQGTHSGNLLCLIASHKNLEILLRDETQKRLLENSEILDEYCKKVANLDNVKKVNQRGLIAGIILENKEAADKAVFKMIENGVLPVCTNRESIKLGPPLNIEPSALREAMEVVLESLC